MSAVDLDQFFIAKDGAVLVAERLRDAVAQHQFRFESTPVTLTISIGVASAATGSDDRDRLLSRADDALYAAKTRGRNCVIVRPPAVAASKIGSSRTEDAGLAIQS